ELAPLLVVARHVHVQHQAGVALLDHGREMRAEQRAAGAGHQQDEAVGAHEGEHLGAVLDLVVGRRVHQSTSATACAAMPSPRPIAPSRSVVVALRLIAPPARPRSAAMLAIMRGMWGAIRGSWATI